MLYTDDPVTDRNNIINYIDEFFGTVADEAVLVDSYEVYDVCVRMRAKFPHVDGIDKASAFKKVANFVAHFLELKPIKSEVNIPISGLSTYDINAVVAFDIALACLEHSAIERDGGVKVIVSKPIYVSNHSYTDIIHALSACDIKQKTHFHLLAVLFEQIVYKTNPECEYKDLQKAGDTEVRGYYEYSSGGDDLYGV